MNVRKVWVWVRALAAILIVIVAGVLVGRHIWGASFVVETREGPAYFTLGYPGHVLGDFVYPRGEGRREVEPTLGFYMGGWRHIYPMAFTVDQDGTIVECLGCFGEERITAGWYLLIPTTSLPTGHFDRGIEIVPVSTAPAGLAFDFELEPDLSAYLLGIVWVAFCAATISFLAARRQKGRFARVLGLGIAPSWVVANMAPGVCAAVVVYRLLPWLDPFPRLFVAAIGWHAVSIITLWAVLAAWRWGERWRPPQLTQAWQIVITILMVAVFLGIFLGTVYWARSIEVVPLEDDGPAVFLVAPRYHIERAHLHRVGTHVVDGVWRQELTFFDGLAVTVVGGDGEFFEMEALVDDEGVVVECERCWGMEGLRSGIYFLEPAYLSDNGSSDGLKITPVLPQQRTLTFEEPIHPFGMQQ
jgi:hypothetical protein